MKYTIELAQADARRLAAITETRKGYVSKGHLASVAADILGAALRELEDRSTQTDETDTDETDEDEVRGMSL